VFPEGRRTDAGLQPFRPGIGLLVRESGTPVVPVALVGLSELKQRGKGWFRSGRLTVHIGEPLHFDQDETPEQITAKLHHAVKGLLDKT
jgi:long-chain acyl-CoA synthetase